MNQKEVKNSRIKFRVRYYGEIKRGMVPLPEEYLPHLKGKLIHLVAISSGCLKLTPGEGSFKEAIEKEMKKYSAMQREPKILYLGSTRLKKGGLLFISKKIKKWAALTTQDIVIIGMGESIEIWNKKSWQTKIKKWEKNFKEMEKILLGLVCKNA